MVSAKIIDHSTFELEEDELMYSNIHQEFETTVLEKYSKVKSPNRVSSIGPCISPLTSEMSFTQGVYNCVSVAAVTESGKGIMMHSIPSQALHFLDTFVEEILNENATIKSILVAGGAEEGKRKAMQIYSELKEISNDVEFATPLNAHSSISVGIDPSIPRIDYAVVQYAYNKI